MNPSVHSDVNRMCTLVMNSAESLSHQVEILLVLLRTSTFQNSTLNQQKNWNNLVACQAIVNDPFILWHFSVIWSVILCFPPAMIFKNIILLPQIYYYLCFKRREPITQRRKVISQKNLYLSLNRITVKTEDSQIRQCQDGITRSGLFALFLALDYKFMNNK
jgi:hypothetical protein